jgi:hypothetical protein
MSIWPSLTPFENRVNSVYLSALFSTYALDFVSTQAAIYTGRGKEWNALHPQTEAGYVLPLIWLISIPIQIVAMRRSLAGVRNGVALREWPSSFSEWLVYISYTGLRFSGLGACLALNLIGGLIAATIFHFQIALNNVCIGASGIGCIANLTQQDTPIGMLWKFAPWFAGAVAIGTALCVWIALKSRGNK